MPPPPLTTILALSQARLLEIRHQAVRGAHQVALSGGRYRDAGVDQRFSASK